MKKKALWLTLTALAVCLVMALGACGIKKEAVDPTLESAYNAAVAGGFEGTFEDYIEYIQGDSAYEIAVKNGFEGTEKEWLTYLKGQDGVDGKSLTALGVYEEAVNQGYEGSYLDFLSEYLNLTADTGTSSTIRNEALLASVSVYCSFDIASVDFFGRSAGTQIGMSAGSGVIYGLNKEQGSAYIVTNYHVVYSAESKQGISENILVYLYGSEIMGNELYTEEYARQLNSSAPEYRGMGIEAEYIGGSQHYDIALLYVENSDILKNSNAVAAEFADSNDIFVSQTAFAVGNAEGEGISVTKGVVSVDSENLQMTVADNSETTSFRVVRIDTAVNSGNSGGGLFDDNGKLIGIVNAKTNADGVENIGYALPSNVVKYIVQNILDYKDSPDKAADVKKCMLGITISSRRSSAVLDEETGKVRIKESVMINEVSPDGLAAGKLAANDILVSVKIHHVGDAEGVYEEHEVDRSFVIVDLMLTMRVGDTLLLTYDRTEDGVTTRGEAEFVMTEACINPVN